MIDNSYVENSLYLPLLLKARMELNKEVNRKVLLTVAYYCVRTYLSLTVSVPLSIMHLYCLSV